MNLKNYRSVQVTANELNQIKNKIPKNSSSYKILKHFFDKQNFKKGYARGVYYDYLCRCLAGYIKIHNLEI